MIASNCRQTAIFIFIRDRQCSRLIITIQSASSIYAGLPVAGAALQLVLAIQLQRHIAGAGNGHSILCSIPCVHLQISQDDIQLLGRFIDDLHHIAGGVLRLFGKGDGGVGSLVGLLLSGLFLLSLLLRRQAWRAGLAAVLAGAFGSYWSYSIT